MSTAVAKTTTRNQRPSTFWSEVVGTVVIAGGLIAYATWDDYQEKAAIAERARILSPTEVATALASLSQPVRECMTERYGDGRREFNNGPFRDNIEVCEYQNTERQRQAERVRAFASAIARP
jgi:hypothetical protein